MRLKSEYTAMMPAPKFTGWESDSTGMKQATAHPILWLLSIITKMLILVKTLPKWQIIKYYSSFYKHYVNGLIADIGNLTSSII